jgi:hypothetical protein
VTQKADSVAIVCKNFSVDAEMVTVKSSKDTSHEATGKYTVKSTGDMSMTTQAALAAKSTGDTTITATGALTAKATGDATVKGMNATLQGEMATTVKGGTSVDLKALQITGTADAKMEMGGPMTTVGKNLTTISGQIVKVEGTLVKLG